MIRSGLCLAILLLIAGGSVVISVIGAYHNLSTNTAIATQLHADQLEAAR